MKILFLGLECPLIEKHLLDLKHSFFRTEAKLNLEFLQQNIFDYCISYRYRHIIPYEQIDFFGNSIINMHISLLPWNRGSDPNLWSFLEDTPKGVTIHKIDTGLDTGDILLQKEVFFDESKETLASSYLYLSKTVEQLFIDNCNKLFYHAIPCSPQINGGTYHKLQDKAPWLYLLEKDGWNTKVASLVGSAL